MSIVGLPETAVKESKDRVRSAILNSHFEFPARRITVNLAPADLPKEGGRFDLAIALGILAASEQLPNDSLSTFEFLGELALSGELRPVRGILPATLASKQSSRSLVVPVDNSAEAALNDDANVLIARSLLEVSAHLHNRGELQKAKPYNATTSTQSRATTTPDLNEVHGQAQAKRALEIAAAGGHNILFYGPPGTGKTMLASRLPGILPAMEQSEALETASIYSVAKGQITSQWQERPFRNPHHTASAVALVGGGSHPKPGEVSLAHNGVLFLDELPEFQRQVLEVLREPLESGEIAISRANAQISFPAKFQLIAAMNPCPCGYAGSRDGRCHCTPDQVLRYRRKISGPLLDRFDLHVQVNSIAAKDLQRLPTGDSTAIVKARVAEVRKMQMARQGKANFSLKGEQLIDACQLSTEQQDLLSNAMEKFGLSARAYHRILRVARTIADLAFSQKIETAHLTEALSYRQLDRRTQRALA